MVVELSNIVLPLKDGSQVVFVANENIDHGIWQQAVAYVQNVRRMGYK
jgi:hypothetical protein